jgi:UDP-N-acetylglucosamine 2-epimerase
MLRSRPRKATLNQQQKEQDLGEHFSLKSQHNQILVFKHRRINNVQNLRHVYHSIIKLFSNKPFKHELKKADVNNKKSSEILSELSCVGNRLEYPVDAKTIKEIFNRKLFQLFPIHWNNSH